jgi:hypothetical protein
MAYSCNPKNNCYRPFIMTSGSQRVNIKRLANLVRSRQKSNWLDGFHSSTCTSFLNELYLIFPLPKAWFYVWNFISQSLSQSLDIKTKYSPFISFFTLFVSSPFPLFLPSSQHTETVKPKKIKGRPHHSNVHIIIESKGRPLYPSSPPLLISQINSDLPLSDFRSPSLWLRLISLQNLQNPHSQKLHPPPPRATLQLQWTKLRPRVGFLEPAGLGKNGRNPCPRAQS